MNVLHIAWRELRAIFTTPVGWLVLCGWLLVTGLAWVAVIESYVVDSEDVFNPYGPQTVNLTDWVLVPFYGSICAIVLVMTLPALSMRVFSEELRSRSIELLMTSPVSTAEIVLGKFLGVLGFVAVMLAATLQYPIGLAQWGSPDPGVVAGIYLALLLLSAAELSVGLLASALTDNQVVAFVLTFAVALGLMFVGWQSDDPTDWLAQISIMGHAEDMMRGALRLSDLVYYLVFTGFFLFATHQRVETFRWR